MSDERKQNTIDTIISIFLIFSIVGVSMSLYTGLLQPVVIVSSGSMEPNIQQGSHIVLVKQHTPPEKINATHKTVTYKQGKQNNYKTFNDYGDVIVFEPNGNENRISVIHRPQFWVEEGENWIYKANFSYLPNNTVSCMQVPNCPAPHSGFITKGDANQYYDQTRNISAPVKPAWIHGYAITQITNLPILYIFFVSSLILLVFKLKPIVSKVRLKAQSYISSKYN